MAHLGKFNRAKGMKINMKNRLFLVEGLPCSGKSTTSKFIKEVLEKQGKKVVWIDEGTGNHPADYEFQSYITEALFDAQTKEDQEILSRASVRKNNGYIVQLGKLQGELFEKMLQYKIYDFLDWEVEKELMLDKWRAFAKEADQECIYVFNCCFLQNPMCETMMRFNQDINQSKAYIKEILEAIKPMQPVCIYLQNEEIEGKIKEALEERGNDWLNSVIQYHTEGAYGKAQGLKGFEGYVACLEERQRREVNILQDLNMEQLVINEASSNWKETYEKIESFIQELS